MNWKLRLWRRQDSNHVILIPEHQIVSPQRKDYIVLNLQILRIGKILNPEKPLYLLHAFRRKIYHFVFFIDNEISRFFLEFLGLTVGVVLNSMDNDERREAYNCDITYVTNNELGFDYLRDNMVIYKEQLVQRELHYAIIDEVDSVLIDEARTPHNVCRA